MKKCIWCGNNCDMDYYSNAILIEQELFKEKTSGKAFAINGFSDDQKKVKTSVIRNCTKSIASTVVSLNPKEKIIRVSTYADMWEGDGITSVIKINYCPMCGKKFE